MAKNVVIRDVVYNSVPSVEIPLSGETGNAKFYDISDATISSNAQSLDGVISYGADGTKYTGSIETKSSSDITVSGRTVTIPAGYYETQNSKAVQQAVLTLPSTLASAEASVSSAANNRVQLMAEQVLISATLSSAGYVSTAPSSNAVVRLTANITTKPAATITPTTSDQTIASGTYLTGTQTIKGDANLTASNIVSGVSIFGVAGTAQVPSISQDSTTKVLTIA